jgi:hypothetical protein
MNTDGTFSYTPEANYFGSDSFSYRLTHLLHQAKNIYCYSVC